MGETYFGNAYRNTMICVDSYENSIMQGYLYNPALNEGVYFDSVMQLLLSMEELLDSMNFPQNFNAKRCFLPMERGMDLEHDVGERRGRKASFVIKVLFRQNASWQGSVTWVDGEREESFRSVLELLLLMNSVLREESAQ